MEVTKTKTISSTNEYTGTYDGVYTITGQARIEGKRIVSVENGNVRTDDLQVATFSQYSEGNGNVSFTGVNETAKKVEITQAIDAFMAAVNEEVNNINS